MVVPVFNNRETLEELCSRLVVSASGMSAADCSYEIIFVDDGSTDDSWTLLLNAFEVHSGVRLVRLSRNFGQYAATVAGWREARGDCIITISADLQDPPELIPSLIEAWDRGNKIVLANRGKRNDGPVLNLASKIAYGMARGSIRGLPDGGFDFYLIDRTALNELLRFTAPHSFGQGDILYVGFPRESIPYERARRGSGKSGYKFTARAKYFRDILFDATYIPIRFMSFIGVAVATGGVAYAGAVFLAWLRGETPFTGWAPLMIVLLVVSGTTMIMLSVIAEYLWRIFDRMRERPLFVIHERVE